MKIHPIKYLVFVIVICSYSISYSQVGIGTTRPEGALDIDSSTSGVLLPRIALSSATDIPTVINPQGGVLPESTLVYNTGTGGLSLPGYYYWNNSNWVLLEDNSSSSIYHGKAIINSLGVLTITGMPFQPNSISFSAYSNVDSYNLDSDNGVGNNDNTIANAFGYMQGYAQNNSGVLTQQVIYGGGSGNSVNDISRYASSSHCIGLRYSNQNGRSLGTTTAMLTAFTSDGFSLDIDNNSDNVVILYVAYK